MKLIKPIIKLIPFLMLGCSILASIIVDTKVYAFIYPFLGDVIGYSILTNVYFLYFAYRANMCDYVKISTWGLLSLNVLNILDPLIQSRYSDFYSTISAFIFFSIASYYLIMKNEPRKRDSGY